MTKKQYTSYQEIDRDLKILKLQKEIHYQKILQEGQQIKESMKFTSVLPDVAIGVVDTFSRGFKGATLSFILRKIFSRR